MIQWPNVEQDQRFQIGQIDQRLQAELSKDARRQIEVRQLR